MKICFIVGTLARGGAEKQLVFMLRALKQAHIDAEVLCLTRGESYESEIRNLSVSVEYVGTTKNQPARLWQIIRKLRQMQADVVQSSHFYTNVYAGFAGRFFQIPSIGAVRSDLTYELESHPLSGRWQIRLPHFLAVNSNAARRRLIKRGISPDKIEFVRNVVHIEECKQQKITRDSLKILFAGRLDRNKRADRFIRLAAFLTDRFPKKKLQFQIAGDGKLRVELEQLATELGLKPDRLTFLGACGDMSKIYQHSDILINTSEREGTPNVVLEAMAYGLAVVATDVGGTPEIINQTRGILIAPDKENELFEAASGLIINDDLRRRLGAESRYYVRQNYSLEVLQNHLVRFYERITHTEMTVHSHDKIVPVNADLL